ncbi:hypothetical protein ACU4GD_27610 [Cupriavidus basilensis]
MRKKVRRHQRRRCRRACADRTSTTSSATCTARSTRCPPMASTYQRAAATTPTLVRQQLLRVPIVAKVELLGDQDEKIYIEFQQAKLAQMGLDIDRHRHADQPAEQHRPQRRAGHPGR